MDIQTVDTVTGSLLSAGYAHMVSISQFIYKIVCSLVSNVCISFFDFALRERLVKQNQATPLHRDPVTVSTVCMYVHIM